LALIDLELASGEFGTVQFGNSPLAVFLRGHLDKTKSTRAARLAVIYNGRGLDRSDRRKQFFQIRI